MIFQFIFLRDIFIMVGFCFSELLVDGQIRVFLFRAKHKWAEDELGLSMGEQGEPGCHQKQQTG